MDSWSFVIWEPWSYILVFLDNTFFKVSESYDQNWISVVKLFRALEFCSMEASVLYSNCYLIHSF